RPRNQGTAGGDIHSAAAYRADEHRAVGDAYRRVIAYGQGAGGIGSGPEAEIRRNVHHTIGHRDGSRGTGSAADTHTVGKIIGPAGKDRTASVIDLERRNQCKNA